MSEDTEAAWEAQAVVEELSRLDAPWGREITLKSATWGSGLRMVQMRIREKRRFTDVDLDEATVRAMVATLQGWLDGRGG